MPDDIHIETERLILRTWKDSDHEPFSELNADPEVMEFFPKTYTLEETEQTIKNIEAGFEKNGFGFYAAERKDTGEFIGFIGMQWLPFEEKFTPAVEIGWRLAKKHWGLGFATEGARACLAHGFGELNLPEIVAITTPNNERSRNVMVKLGMKHYPEFDFERPTIPVGDPTRPHVMYKITRPEWDWLAL